MVFLFLFVCLFAYLMDLQQYIYKLLLCFFCSCCFCCKKNWNSNYDYNDDNDTRLHYTIYVIFLLLTHLVFFSSFQRNEKSFQLMQLRNKNIQLNWIAKLSRNNRHRRHHCFYLSLRDFCLLFCLFAAVFCRDW